MCAVHKWRKYQLGALRVLMLPMSQKSNQIKTTKNTHEAWSQIKRNKLKQNINLPDPITAANSNEIRCTWYNFRFNAKVVTVLDYTKSSIQSDKVYSVQYHSFGTASFPPLQSPIPLVPSYSIASHRIASHRNHHTIK